MRIISILLLIVALGVLIAGCINVFGIPVLESSDYLLLGITYLIIGKISDAIASSREDDNGKNSSP